MAYSDKVIDHYENPRNVGSLPKDDVNVGTGLVGAPECGDVMKLQVKVNPLTGVIDGVRWAVLGKGVPHYIVFGTSAAMGVVILLSGLVFFRHTERGFADTI